MSSCFQLEQRKQTKNTSVHFVYLSRALRIVGSIVNLKTKKPTFSTYERISCIYQDSSQQILINNGLKNIESALKGDTKKNRGNMMDYRKDVCRKCLDKLCNQEELQYSILTHIYGI